MMRKRLNAVSAGLGTLMVLASVPSVHAECYDVFGCSDRTYFRLNDLMRGPNCEFLWQMRNSMYKERGYCFNTRRGIATFGNAGCQYDNVNEVPLNQFERANAATIQQAERALACPR